MGSDIGTMTVKCLLFMTIGVLLFHFGSLNSHNKEEQGIAESSNVERNIRSPDKKSNINRNKGKKKKQKRKKDRKQRKGKGRTKKKELEKTKLNQKLKTNNRTKGSRNIKSRTKL